MCSPLRLLPRLADEETLGHVTNSHVLPRVDSDAAGVTVCYLDRKQQQAKTRVTKPKLTLC